MIRDAGIHLSATNILGIPTGTLADDLATMKLNSDSRISYAHAFLFQPYPGTELGQYAEDNGFMAGTMEDIGEIAWDSSIMVFQSDDEKRVGDVVERARECAEGHFEPLLRDQVAERRDDQRLRR